MRILIVLFFIFVTSSSCDVKSSEKFTGENPEENSVELDTNKVLQPKDYFPKIEMVITKILSRYHYKNVEINDSLSEIIFDNYIDALDYNKMYFLKRDIEKFKKYHDKIDDFLYDGVLEPPYEIFNVYKKRLNQRMNYVFARLKKEFDFTIDEYYEPDRADAEWAQTEDELNELWRKRLKHEALNLKLTGKKWDKVVETLVKRYQNYQKAILRYKSEDVFDLFMNVFANAIDPHTAYFSPRESENFDIRMKLSLEGIGALLQQDGDYTKVVRIIPGGPAYKSGLLHPDDKIVAVGQGKEGELVDVIGWRIDDVVQMIRGKKGTIVRLAIIEANSSSDVATDTISLVRDKVKLEERAAKKEITEVEEHGKKYKIGVIKIPSFYIDFEAKRKGIADYKSTTRDVRKLLNELKDSVDAVVIDLRNNGGGALDEAISLTGLFIKLGPVVQVRNSNGKIDIGEDTDPDIVYSGPLGVLVNRFSASASEIFSAAIQDYGRGLVLGEQTYGKGTVQNLIDLKRFLPAIDGKAGELKLTVAKFYRITGSSTQNLGVIPDIKFPTPIDPDEFGESSNPSALEWDRISPTRFTKYADLSPLIPQLVKEHEERLKTEPEFQYILEDIAEYKKNKEKKKYSLLESVRREEKEKNDKKKKMREEARKKILGITGDEKGKEKPKNLKIDDPNLEETGHVMADFIILNNSGR